MKIKFSSVLFITLKNDMARSRLKAVAAFLLATMALGGAAHATSYTWSVNTAGPNSWNATTNWSAAPAFPVNAGDVANINNDITANQTINLNTAITVGIINIGDANNTHTFTIAANAGTLTLNNSGAGAQINEASTAKGDTISAGIILGDNLAVTSASGNNFTLSGGVTGSGNLTLAANGAGAVTVSTVSVNNTGTVTSAGLGSGTLSISSVIGTNVTGVTQNSKTNTSILSLSGVNTFTGAVSILAGKLVVGADTGLGAAANNVLLGDTSGNVNATLEVNNNNGTTVTRVITVQSGNTGTAALQSTAASTGGNTYSGTINLGNGATGHGLTLNTSQAALNLKISSVIQDGAGVTGGFGAVTISSVGSASPGGIVLLNGANTFQGGVNLSQNANLSLTNAAALGTGTLSINGGNIIQTANQTTSTNNNTEIWNNDFSYTGAFSLNIGTGTVDLGAAVGAANRSVTVNAGGTLTVGHAVNGSNGTTNSLTKLGNGTLIIGGASSYTGGTTIVAGNLQFGTSAPATGTITINTAGTLALSTTSGTPVATLLGSGLVDAASTGGIALIGADNENINFNTNGYNLRLGAFVNSTYTGTLTPNGSTYRLGGGGATLTLSNANALTGTNGLVVGDTSNLGLFATTGTVALSNASNMSGATIVKAGTLNFSTVLGSLANSDVAATTASISIDNSGGGTPSASYTRAKSVSLAGAGMTVAGASTGNSNDVITNALMLSSGLSTITVTPNAGKNAELSAASLVRNSNAFGFVNGVNLGKSAVGTAGVGNIVFGTPPAMIGSGTTSGGINNAQQNTAIIPYLVGEASATAGTASGTPNTFVTYDTTTGLRPLSSGEFSNSFIAGNNVSLTATATAVGTLSINSLVAQLNSTAYSIVIGNATGASLNIASGAMLFTTGAGSNSNSVTISGFDSTAALDFGANQAIVTVNPNTTNTFGVPNTNTAFFSTHVTGSGGLAKLGGGTLSLSASNSYTGVTEILNGSLAAANNFAFGSDTSDVLLGDVSGTASATLQINDGGARTVNLARNVTVQSGNTGTASIFLRSTSGQTGVTASGTITLGSGGIAHNLTITNALAQTFQSSTVSGVIQDPAGLTGQAGVVSVVTGGNNTLVISGHNTYTGGTILSSADGTGGVTAGDNSAFGTGTVTFLSGATLGASGKTLANNIIVNGNAALGGTGITLTGSVSLMGNNNITITSLGVAAINGVISDSVPGANNSLNITGANFGSTLSLGGANTFGGGLSMASNTSNGGSFTLNINNLGTTSTASALGTGTFTIGSPLGSAPLTMVIANGSGTSGTLSTNNAEVWNGDFTYNSASSLNMGTGAVSLGTVYGNTRTITVANTAGSFETDGIISNGSNGSSPVTGLALNGPGKLILGGANTYTGATTINSGTLSTGILANGGTASGIGQSSSAASNLVLGNGAALQYTGTGASTDRGFTINGTAAGNGAILDASGSGAVNFTNTATPLYGTTGQTRTLTLTGVNTGSNTLAALIANNGAGAVSITKSGAGTWVLSNSNSYTGATTINGGTLKINGSLTGTSAVTVGGVGANNTPTLGGGIGSANGGSLQSLIGAATSQIYNPSSTIGSIAGAVIISGTAAGATAGHLAPGNSVGTMTVGTLALSGGSILDYEFNGSANDFTMVTTSGGLTINGGGFNLYQEGGTNAFATNGTYDLIGYTGSIVGTGTSALSVLNQQVGKTYVFGTAVSGGTNYITLTISGSVSTTSTTYSLSSSATTTKIFTSGSTSISTTIANTGTGTADTLDYTGLGGSATGGSVSGSTTSGTGLANGGGSGTNSGQTYVAGTTSGTFVVNPVGTGTNHTLGTAATLSGSTPVSVSVYDQASLTTSTTTGNQATPANLILTNGTSTGGASGQRAGVTVTGLSASNVQATDNTNNFATPVTTGSAVADAHGTTTSATVGTASVLGKRLNGTYTETVTGTTRYTDNTLNGQQSVGNQTWNITATVSGNASTGRGDVYTANVLSGKAYGTSNSSGFSLGSNLTGSGHQATTATLLNSSLTASATTDVNMSFDKTTANSVVNNFRTSDILTLSGLNSTSPISGVQLTDVYVLQLSYDTSATGVQYLGWNNGSQFVNAISGDSTGNTTPYLDGSEVVGAYSGQTTVGTYGYDPTNHVVWAVLNHGGLTNGSGALIAGTNEFAAIPEPSTWGMILGGFGMLVGFQRMRKRWMGI